MAVEGGAPEAPTGRLETAEAAAAAPGEGPARASGLLVASTAPAAEGLGGRLAVAGSLLLAGLVVGIMTTVLHRARLGVGGAPIWLGIVVCLAVIAVLALGLRLYLRERGGAIAFAVGVVIAIAVLATWSAGHSVIVVADLIGTIWISAAPIIAWAIALWPEVGRRPRASAGDAPAASAAMTPAGPAGASAAPSAPPAASASGARAHYAGASNPAPEEPLP